MSKIEMFKKVKEYLAMVFTPLFLACLICLIRGEDTEGFLSAFYYSLGVVLFVVDIFNVEEEK